MSHVLLTIPQYGKDQMMTYRFLPGLSLVTAVTLASITPITLAAPPDASAKLPAFETASINENRTGDGRWRMELTPDGFTAMGVSLQRIIQEAYGVYDDHLWSGGPAWLKSDKFDIDAKFDPSEYRNLTLEQRRFMLQKLLADRFHLVVHHEVKTLPIYALVPTASGPRLQASKPEDIHYGEVHGAMCWHLKGGKGSFELQGCTTENLASQLTSAIKASSSATTAPRDGSRIVVDETGLTGRYNFKLNWTANDSDSTAADPSEISLFDALQQQLGLKLESTDGQLDTIVIDRVETLSAN
jgi:uncharacterized protein (TIGR03435 family)